MRGGGRKEKKKKKKKVEAKRNKTSELNVIN